MSKSLNVGKLDPKDDANQATPVEELELVVLKYEFPD